MEIILPSDRLTLVTYKRSLDSHRPFSKPKIRLEVKIASRWHRLAVVISPFDRLSPVSYWRPVVIVHVAPFTKYHKFSRL